MPKRKPIPTSPEMIKAQEAFKHWRKTRKSRKPIPEELWQLAMSLSKTHSVNQISKGLILSHTDLKNRIKLESNHPEEVSPFVEIDVPSSVFQTSECVVELADGQGARMKMYFKGETGIDLLELGKTFLGKRR